VRLAWGYSPHSQQSTFTHVTPGRVLFCIWQATTQPQQPAQRDKSMSIACLVMIHPFLLGAFATAPIHVHTLGKAYGAADHLSRSTVYVGILLEWEHFDSAGHLANMADAMPFCK
jgi:hypothetical protein